MTYRDLLQKLTDLTEEQLNQNVTVFFKYADEYVPIEGMKIADEDDVLDKGHPYMVAE